MPQTAADETTAASVVARLLTAVYVVYYTVSTAIRDTGLLLMYRLLPASAYDALPVLPHPFTVHIPAAASGGNTAAAADDHDMFVMVTGTSSGIGWDAALGLCARGYSVLATVRREADGQRLLEESHRQDMRGEIVPLLLEVDRHESVVAARESWLRIQRERHGRAKLVALVCNAGIAPGSPVECMTYQDMRKCIDTNITGVVDLTQTFLPFLREARGRLLLVGSLSGEVSVPLMGVYSMTKFALEALADALRLELRPQGVAVSLIKPGAIKTPAFNKVDVAAKEQWDKMPKAVREVYRVILETGQAMTMQTYDRGLHAKYTTQTIVDAIQNRFPRTRYYVGTDALILCAVRRNITVDEAWDGLVALALKAVYRQAKSAGTIAATTSAEDAAASAMRQDSIEMK